jgi:hypothetical protein
MPQVEISSPIDRKTPHGRGVFAFLPHHDLRLDFHEDFFCDFSITPWDNTFLCDLNRLSSFACDEEDIPLSEHNQRRTNSIFTRRNNPEIFSFSSFDTLTHITDDRE